MSLQYYGMLSLPHSWAVVSTEILLQLQAKGYTFRSISTNGPATVHNNLKPTLIPPQTQIINGAVRGVVRPIKTDISLSYTIPPNLRQVPADHRIHIYNYETTKMPEGWGRMMNSFAHLILPSSNFSKQIFLANGVEEKRMVVLPHGYDPNIYNPSVAPATLNNVDDHRFKFLTVAISHWRKGYDVLLKAYIEEFKGDDSVVLIMKVGTEPKRVNGADVPCVIDVQQIIQKLQQTHRYKWPEIRTIANRFDNLARLYNAVDAVVLPTRSECFSLTVLEAAACKKPVITTDYGGHLDFLNKQNSNLIDYALRPAPREGQYWGYQKDALIAEPSVEHLKQLMRDVKNNYDQAKQKAEIAYNDVKDKYTWAVVTDQLIQLVQERGWKL